MGQHPSISPKPVRDGHGGGGHSSLPANSVDEDVTSQGPPHSTPTKTVRHQRFNAGPRATRLFQPTVSAADWSATARGHRSDPTAPCEAGRAPICTSG